MTEARDPARFEPDVRFVLANERTLLAWLRTSLALQAGGLAVLQFATTLDHRTAFAVVLLITGAVCGAMGLWRYRAADRAIRSETLPEHGHGPVLITAFVIVIGVVLAIAAVLANT
jgi:putative membrane protein